MSTKKHNWQEIKQKYLESQEIELMVFLRGFFGYAHNKRVPSGYLRSCVGWREEKEQLLRVQTERAKQELENDPKVKIANTHILKAINNYEVIVANLIGKGTLTLEEAVKARSLWEVLRVSQNLPTTFVKSENENTNNNREIRFVKTIITQDNGDQRDQT